MLSMRRRRQVEDYEVFPAELVRETDKAWLFLVEEVEEELWLPKSECVWEEDEGEVWIPKWLAEKKELI